jgi:hypothetical protein
MTLEAPETLLERARRTRGNLAGTGDPRAVRVAVDGPCPSGDCDERIVAQVHADTTSVRCPGCGATFAL